ncbi:hypothetical protein HY570_00275 [Candidatus Micrarchaeota archaeon]|nr:hypothetical protein [Candidatus Micrarchaeota archaeon]
MLKNAAIASIIILVLLLGCTQGPVIPLNKSVGNLTLVFNISNDSVLIQDIDNETVEEQVDEAEEPKVEVAKESKVTLTFNVNIPEYTPPNEKIYLVLKDFTNYQKQRIEMSKVDDRNWRADVKVEKGSLVRYVYDRGLHADDPYNKFPRGKKESFSKDVQITFRYAYAGNDVTINDAVADWEDIQASRNDSGTFEGYVKDSENKAIVDATVSIAGVHLGTDYEGRFKLAGITPGMQNVVITTNDGSYKYHTQEVGIKSAEKTNVNFTLEKSRKINVVFNVEVPEDTPKYANVRIFGNVEQLGSVQWYRNALYAENMRFAAMNKSGNVFTVNLELYEGSYVEYVYSLGSSTLLTEVKDSGSSLIRSFVVDSQSNIKNEKIGGWRAQNQDATSLIVSVPSGGEEPVLFVSNGYVQMHKYADERWALTIYGYKPDAYYFARGMVPDGRELVSEKRGVKTDVGGDISITNIVSSWVWLDSAIVLNYTMKPLITPKARNFVNGVTLKEEYTPDYLPLYSSTFKRLKANNVSWVGIPLLWQMSSIEPMPEIEFRSIKNYPIGPSISDIKKIVREAREKDLKVILHSQIVARNTKGNIAEPHDDEWFDKYLEELERTLVFNAVIANETNAEMLVIPRNGHLQFKNPTYKSKFDTRMQNILDKVRARYYGKLISDDSYEAAMSYEYFKKLDYVGLYWFERLNIRNDASLEEIEVAINGLLNSKYKEVSLRNNKSVVITQFAYASVDGSINQVPEIAENLEDNANVKLDVEEQARVYEAFLRVVADKEWLNGSLAFNYGLIDQPEGKSFDIRAKPAEVVLSNYYSLYEDEGKNLTQAKENRIPGLDFADYTLVLLDLTVPSDGISCASLGIYSKQDELLQQVKVCPGESYSWIAPDGRRFRIVVYDTSPGYLLRSIWAEVAVFG